MTLFGGMRRCRNSAVQGSSAEEARACPNPGAFVGPSGNDSSGYEPWHFYLEGSWVGITSTHRLLMFHGGLIVGVKNKDETNVCLKRFIFRWELLGMPTLA